MLFLESAAETFAKLAAAMTLDERNELYAHHLDGRLRLTAHEKDVLAAAVVAIAKRKGVDPEAIAEVEANGLPAKLVTYLRVQGRRGSPKKVAPQVESPTEPLVTRSQAGLGSESGVRRAPKGAPYRKDGKLAEKLADIELWEMRRGLTYLDYVLLAVQQVSGIQNPGQDVHLNVTLNQIKHEEFNRETIERALTMADNELKQRGLTGGLNYHEFMHFIRIVRRHNTAGGFGRAPADEDRSHLIKNYRDILIRTFG